MSTSSSIEWTDTTWNPVVGCTMVSPGCARCYAETMSKRLEGMANADLAMGKNPGRKMHYIHILNDRGRWNDRVELVPEALADPLSWRKPRKVFVNSMSDLFHEAVPFDFVDKVFAIMAMTPQHIFQVLTKRPERMTEYTTAYDLPQRIHEAVKHRMGYDNPRRPAINREDLPLLNVWLGTSVEDQPRADERIPHLLRCPAAVRFLSVEPLLGAVRIKLCSMCGNVTHDHFPGDATTVAGVPPEIHWVIVGGESGPGARPCKMEWIRSVVEQCREAAVPCFVKQLGSVLAVSDPKGGTMADFPDDLQVRQFPPSLVEVQS